MQRHTLPLRPLLGTLLLGLLLAGCDASRDDATALGPVPIASGDECHVCGMLIEEMPGPKGEAVLPGAVRKFFVENPSKFDPREFLKPAREAAKLVCKARFDP